MREQLKLLEDLKQVDEQLLETEDALAELPKKPDDMKQDVARVERLLEGERQRAEEVRNYRKNLEDEVKAEQEMLDIEEFDEALVEELRQRAKDLLLTRAIASEEQLGDARPADDLLTMEGMDEDLAYRMAAAGIVTMEDLAEQAVDELLELGDLEEERAAALIMKAREPWFAEAADDAQSGVGANG